MCEVLLRVVSKLQPDLYLSCKLLERGDIVVVCADGWAWSDEEKRNPDWRILKLPNVPLATAEGFLGQEFDEDPANPSRVLRRRAFMLDIDHVSIPAAFKTWLLDSTRSLPARTVNYTAAEFAALKKTKTRLIDPNVLSRIHGNGRN